MAHVTIYSLVSVLYAGLEITEASKDARERRKPVMRRMLSAMFLLVPLSCAFAYVDPGTGSMVVQVVIAALVAGGAFVAGFWRRLFRRRRRDDDSQADTERD